MPEFLGGWHLIVLLVVVLLLFGAKRLPDSARSLGRSMRIFKAETKGLVNDGKDDHAAAGDDAREGLNGKASAGTEVIPPPLPVAAPTPVQATPVQATPAAPAPQPVRTEAR